MAFHNQITLMGNIGKAPETKTLPGGTEMATFSLAVQMRTKVGDGWEYIAEWHNCKAFGDLATRIGKMDKGAKIGVIGEQRIETWEKEGQRQYRHVVNVQQVQVISRPISDAQLASTYAPGYQPSQPPKEQGGENVFPMHQTAVQGDAAADDDLPF